MFPCGHCEIFENTYFEEHLRRSTSVWQHISMERQVSVGQLDIQAFILFLRNNMLLKRICFLQVIYFPH